VTQSVRVLHPGAPPQLIHLVAVRQPASQPELSDVVVSVGERADHRDGLIELATVRQPAGDLTPGVIVPRLCMLAKFIDTVVLGQHVSPPPSRLVLGVSIGWPGGDLFTALSRVMIASSGSTARASPPVRS
jgi:hypothetical protein